MDRRATLADVAERAGLSKTAVSLVLNNRPGVRLSADAVERVHEAARALNYRPNPAARSLRMGKTRTVGLISDNVTVTRYASAMIRGALDSAEERDHAVLIAETGSDRRRIERALEVMLDRRADGIIFGSMAARPAHLPEIPPGVPVVLLNATGSPEQATVLPAEFDAGYAMTRLLLDAGHRDRIGLIGHSPRAIDGPEVSATIGHRFAGIRTALAEAEVQPVATVDIDDWEPQHGYEGTRGLLERGVELTALICLNDRLAFGAYQAVQERGLRVPQDLSVASFDDDEIAAYLRPGLTTARIPYEEMGRQAMEMLLDRGGSVEHRLVDMPVQVRESIGPCVADAPARRTAPPASGRRA